MYLKIGRDLFPNSLQFIIILKCEGKVVPVLSLTEHHAMKAYWESGGIAPRVLYLGTRWR
jgi:hypothetical protein